MDWLSYLAERGGMKWRENGQFVMRAPIPLLLVGHLALTLTLAMLLNLWVDEAYTLHTTSQGLFYAFDQALWFEVQPPLYFILLTLWRQVSSSLLWARLLSILCAAATVALLPRLARRFCPTHHPVWLTAMVAFHPFLIWAATEARVYALTIFLSALSLPWFLDGYAVDSPSRKARWKHGFVVSAALLTQYYLGFLFAAQAGALLLLRRWRAFMDFCIAMAIVGVSLIPLFIAVSTQMSTHTAVLQNALPLTDAFTTLFSKAVDFMLPAEWPPLTRVQGDILLGSLLVIGVWRWWKKDPPLVFSLRVLWILAALLMVALTLVLAHVGERELMGRRHAAGLFLPALLTVGSVMAHAPKRAVLPLWSALSLVFCLLSLGSVYRPLAKLGDWDRVARYLETVAEPGQVIAVFPGEVNLGLSYYYTGANPIAPLPRGAAFATYDIQRFVIDEEQEIVQALTAATTDLSWIWLVTFDFVDCRFLGVDFGCQVVERFIDDHYTVESTRQFFGSRVRLLRRKTADQVLAEENESTHGFQELRSRETAD